MSMRLNNFVIIKPDGSTFKSLLDVEVESFDVVIGNKAKSVKGITFDPEDADIEIASKVGKDKK